MAADVIPFARRQAPPPEADGPHMSGEAFCIGCRHTWVAVAPAGTVDLLCPGCTSMKGMFKFATQPAPGTLVRVCRCENNLFYLTPDGHMCANCGQFQFY